MTSISIGAMSTSEPGRGNLKEASGVMQRALALKQHPLIGSVEYSY
jgi:hypothetical protein